jgi:hypothetical protein
MTGRIPGCPRERQLVAANLWCVRGARAGAYSTQDRIPVLPANGSRSSRQRLVHVDLLRA